MIDDSFIRSFEEFDEKVPHVAKVIVQRGIDYELLATGDESEIEITPESSEAFQAVYFIFREMVECTSEMTADEFEYYFTLLLTACALVSMMGDGLVSENDEGKYTLTKKGKSAI